MIKAHPYLNFDGNTEEAFTFYRSVFGGEFSAVIRFRDFPDNVMGVSESELDKIAHIALPLGEDTLLMATDVVGSMPVALTVGNNFYIAIEPESAEEADTLFNALSAGGRIAMPLQQTEWAEKHGSFADRFGVQWMIDYTGSAEFGGPVEG
jgi:PhnB protein